MAKRLPSSASWLRWLTPGLQIKRWLLLLMVSELVLVLGNSTSSVVEMIHAFRLRGRGPRIVAIGGGTGLSSLLRGLKTYTSNLSVIVTVADDGGSSGRLRDEYR